MKVEIDDRKDWLQYRNEVLRKMRKLYNSGELDKSDLSLLSEYKDRLIVETPKHYVDGVAYNDGSWVRFGIFRTRKNGDAVNSIWVKDKKQMVSVIYGYMCFLRLAGVRDKMTAIYFTAILFEHLRYRKGMFPLSTNRKVMVNIADNVFSKDLQDIRDNCDCIDSRKFCIDSRHLSRSQCTAKQHKVMDRKAKTYELIAENYDPTLSIRKNETKMREMGLKVSKSTIENWLNEQKVEVSKMVHIKDDETVQNGTDETVQNGTHIEKEGVQNGTHIQEKVSKMASKSYKYDMCMINEYDEAECNSAEEESENKSSIERESEREDYLDMINKEFDRYQAQLRIEEQHLRPILSLNYGVEESMDELIGMLDVEDKVLALQAGQGQSLSEESL